MQKSNDNKGELLNIFGDFFYLSDLNHENHNKIYKNFFDKVYNNNNIDYGSWKLCSTKSDYFDNKLLFNYNPLNFENMLYEELEKHFNNMMLLMNNVCDNDTSNYKINILNVWHNIYKENDFQETHNHSDIGTLFSFVYILKSKDYDKDSKIFFVNPRDSLYTFNDYQNKFKNLNYDKHYIPHLKEGSIIIFPCHLEHGVSVHRNNKNERISISGNLSIID